MYSEGQLLYKVVFSVAIVASAEPVDQIIVQFSLCQLADEFGQKGYDKMGCQNGTILRNTWV